MLLVFEGNFGLGKTTVISKVCDWMTLLDRKLITTEWNSISEIKNAYSHIEKTEKIYSPDLYIYFQLLDMVYRYEKEILPALERGDTVVCDRYYYSLIVRALVRGVNVVPLLKMARMFRKPNHVFYLDGEADLSYERVMPRGEMRTEVWAVGMVVDGDRCAVNLDKYRQHLKENLMFYRQLMCDENITWITANQDPTCVFDAVINKLAEEFKDDR